ncbi:hypothetical protein AXG93_3267s1140 [Marchantia polymorpha subsp. ruderalis]|uniref:Uncharacterized protein n=1 Tax=Marchantia polymorpha subsp. ruderalis TaxID=1480154 RepID=A0A176WQS4_MARPO|nr:hypothetical protein AXG93_3267s1140 [Marchantia polymorpha subsp. ruderalis]
MGRPLSALDRESRITYRPKAHSSVPSVPSVQSVRFSLWWIITDQSPASQPTVRFVTPLTKEDVHVNQVDLSSDKNDEEEEWPKEEVMCGRVDTRSSKRSKDDERETRKHTRKSEGRKSRGEEKTSSKADAKLAGTPLAMRDTPSARPETRTDEDRRGFGTSVKTGVRPGHQGRSHQTSQGSTPCSDADGRTEDVGTFYHFLVSNRKTA